MLKKQVFYRQDYLDEFKPYMGGASPKTGKIF